VHIKVRNEAAANNAELIKTEIKCNKEKMANLIRTKSARMAELIKTESTRNKEEMVELIRTGSAMTKNRKLTEKV
jgi:hypothetical protein